VEAIEHRQPDRAPIDFNPVPDFYLKLKEHLGLEIDENIKVGFMEEAIPHPKVLDALGADMISVKLKAEFGDCLTFHGGVDEQHVLPFGTPQDVEAEVRRRLAAFGPGGGYILAPSRYVQADTSPENIVAMCRAAREFGQHPMDISD